MASRFNSSSVLADRSRPSSVFFVARTAISNIEITIGKLSTAISTLLLLAFAAIPEIRLSDVENPIDVKNSTTRKIN